MKEKKLTLSAIQEKQLKTVGKHEGAEPYQYGLTKRTLDVLRRLRLVSYRPRIDYDTRTVLGHGWFLTSEGFFLFKQLERGRTFHPQPLAEEKKGGSV
jgi:hypothetical protein